MSSLKEMLQQLVTNLPDDCDWRQVYYRLYVARKLHESLQDPSEGRVYSTDEVRQMLEESTREWRDNPGKRHVFVHSREQLIDYLFHVQDEILDSDRRADYRTKTVDYLEALKAWLDTCDGYYQSVGAPLSPDEPSWQLFADALRFAIRFR
jgi:hypothetical protein